MAALLAACVITGCDRSKSPSRSAAPDSTSADSATTTPPVQTTRPADTTTTTAPSTTPNSSSGAASSASSDAPPPLRDAYHTAPLDTVSAKVYAGWKYYNLNCSRCHGEDVQGTTIAPHLIMSLKPDGTIPNEGIFLSTVCGGRPEKGMPAWCTIGLSTAQIDTIYSYVKGRSDARLHPGRPALK